MSTLTSLVPGTLYHLRAVGEGLSINVIPRSLVLQPFFVKLSTCINNHIVGLVHKNHIIIIELSFNHSKGRTHS